MRFLLLALLAAAMWGCTDYQKEWKDKWLSVNGVSPDGDNDASKVYNSEDDLPNCSSGNNGIIVQINGQENQSVCYNRVWYYNIETFNTLDDLKSCSSTRFGKNVYIIEENAVYACNDKGDDRGKWEER